MPLYDRTWPSSSAVGRSSRPRRARASARPGAGPPRGRSTGTTWTGTPGALASTKQRGSSPWTTRASAARHRLAWSAAARAPPSSGTGSWTVSTTGHAPRDAAPARPGRGRVPPRSARARSRAGPGARPRGRRAPTGRARSPAARRGSPSTSGPRRVPSAGPGARGPRPRHRPARPGPRRCARTAERRAGSRCTGRSHPGRMRRRAGPADRGRPDPATVGRRGEPCQRVTGERSWMSGPDGRATCRGPVNGWFTRTLNDG